MNKSAIHPLIKSIKTLTPSEKRVSSEVYRFTVSKKWFFKDMEKFSKELNITKGTLKNILAKLKKLDWIERDRIGIRFQYIMTQVFFDFLDNQSTVEGKPFPAHKSSFLLNKTVETVNLSVEPTVVEEVERKQDKLTITQLQDFLDIDIPKNDNTTHQFLTNIVSVLSKKNIQASDLPEIKKMVKPVDFAQNKLDNKCWGGWSNTFLIKEKGFHISIVEPEIICISPDDFNTEKEMYQFTKTLDEQGKHYEISTVTFNRQRIWESSLTNPNTYAGNDEKIKTALEPKVLSNSSRSMQEMIDLGKIKGRENRLMEVMEQNKKLSENLNKKTYAQ